MDGALSVALILGPWLSAWASWALARDKGRRGLPYALLGFVLPVLGFLITAAAPDISRRRSSSPWAM